MPGVVKVFDSATSSLSLRRRDTNDDNMIPLINIVFLLLIFFMVASQIDAFRPADVTLPEMAATERADAQSYAIVMDAAGVISIAGQEVDLQQLREWVETVAFADPQTKVAVQADKNATAAELAPLLAVLREHQRSRITLIVQQRVTEDS